MSMPPAPTPQNAPPPPEPWGWTRPQRLALGVLTAILIITLAITLWRRPAQLEPARIIEGATEGPASLPQRMNPNTATAAELARIPHIGETLANRIIAYREARKTAAPEGMVFQNLSDLDKISGIGPKLLEQMEPYLEFPQ